MSLQSSVGEPVLWFRSWKGSRPGPWTERVQGVQDQAEPARQEGETETGGHQVNFLSVRDGPAIRPFISGGFLAGYRI